MITYVPGKKKTEYAVKLDGKTVGHIRLSVRGTSSGWGYFPNGEKKSGEIFPTLVECKRSLEGHQ